MPYRQPFTTLCRSLAQDRATGWIDLHIHSTASDGLYTPAQVVDLARRSGLAGLALTDHDTLAGIPAAREAGRQWSLEIIPGVEITAEHRGREMHLLGYFIRLDNGPLLAALDRLREHRVGRFWAMVDRLHAQGLPLERDALAQAAGTGTLGRRRLAEYLVQIRQVATVQDAFRRYLGDRVLAGVPKLCLPAAEAIDLVRGAGGVAALAHPSYDCSREILHELCSFGLGGLEVHYPRYRPARVRELLALADEFGLVATGGSDCHGPDRSRRSIGACGVSTAELAELRCRAAC